MDAITIFGAWISVGLTLCILTFLYKDNPLFKVAENLYVGISIGYLFIITVYQALIPRVFQELSIGNWSPVIPTLIGMTILTRFFRKISWISRYGFAFIIGYAAGLSIPAYVTTNFMKQVEGTVRPFLGGGMSWFASFSTIVIAVGVFCTLMYFFFSIEHKGPVKKIATGGIYFLMVYFGAAFGASVMGRFALLYGRFADLYTYRAAEYYYATPILLVCVIAFLIIFTRKNSTGQTEN